MSLWKIALSTVVREHSNMKEMTLSLTKGGTQLKRCRQLIARTALVHIWTSLFLFQACFDSLIFQCFFCVNAGQYRPIRAVRFIAENTVEERILQLQEKKRLVFDGTVGRDAGSLKMLTVDDMKSLFA